MASTIIFNEHCDPIDDGRQLVDRFHWLDEPERFPFELTCTHLVHFTENESAMEIGNVDRSNNFCFKVSEWKPWNVNNCSIKYLTWWTVVPPKDWKETVKIHISNSHPVLRSRYRDECGNSPAFNGESRCGPIGFVVSWKDILEQYAKSRGKNYDDIQLKVLGTILYRREIMYAILVCIKGDVIKCEDGYENQCKDSYGHGYKDEVIYEYKYPQLKIDTETFLYKNNAKEFTWKVYSISDWAPSDPTHPTCPYGTWDHLSFAFYFSEEHAELNISPRLCSIKQKCASKQRPHSRLYKKDRTPAERCVDEKLVYKLKEKISNDELCAR